MEKEPPSRDRWLIYEEENRLLAASPKWLQEIIIFAVETGCRRGEILSLECKDVDRFKRTVSVFATKTGERRNHSIDGKGIRCSSGEREEPNEGEID
jgi:integrase